METPRPESRDWQALAVLILAGFALRIYLPGTVHYNIDEAMTSIQSAKIFQGYGFPLRGLRTSFGFTNPPTIFYLLAPIFALSHNPIIAQLFVSMLGAGGIAALWRAGWLLGGRRTAFFAATLFAFCPNCLEYARRLWGHDFILPAAALSCWALAAVWRFQDWRALAGAFICAATAQSIHLSGGILWIPALVVTAFPSTRPSGWGKAILTGAVVLTLIYTPWLIYQATNDWEEFAILASLLSDGAAQKELGLPVDPIAVWSQVAGNFWTSDLLGTPRPSMVSASLFLAVLHLSAASTALTAAALSAGAFAFWFQRSPERPLLLALTAAILASPMIFGILLTASVPPYHLPVLPSVLLIGGWLLSKLPYKYGAAMLAVYAIISTVYTIDLRSRLSGELASSASLAEKIAVVDAIGKHSAGRQFAVMQDGRQPELGVDLGYAYLLAAQGLTRRASLAPETAELLYVIVREEAVLRTPLVLELRKWQPAADLPNTTVYTFKGDDARRWVSLVKLHPAGSAQGS